MADLKTCLLRIKEAVQDGKLPEMTNARIKRMAIDLDEIRQASPDNFEAKAAEYIREQQLRESQSRVDELDSAKYSEKIKNFALSNNFDDPSEGLLAFVSRIRQAREGASSGLESQVYAEVGKVQSVVMNRLTKEDLWAVFKSKHNQNDILAEMVEGVPQNRSITGNQEAFRVAQILKTGEKMLFEAKKRAGFTLKERVDRGLAMFWDSTKLWDGKAETKAAALKKFKETIDPLINKDFTFESRSLDTKYQNEYYDKLFHQLYRNQHRWETYDGEIDLDKFVSAERQIVWKDGQSFAKAFKEFSSEKLDSVVFQSYEKEARNIVFRREMGVNPDQAFNDAVKRIVEELEKRNDDAGLVRFNRKLKGIQNTFKQLKGDLSQAPIDPGSRIISDLRSFQVASKLAAASVASLTDNVVVAAKVSTVDGRNVFSNALESYNNVIKSIKSPKERAEVAELLSLSLEVETAANSSRWVAFDNEGRGRAGQYAAAVLKYTGLQGLTNAQYVSASFMLSRRLAQQSAKSWNDLPTGFRGELKRSGFSPAEWDVFRLAKQVAPEEYKSVELLAPKAVRDDVSDDAIDAIMKKHGITDKSVEEFRMDVFDRTSAMMNNMAREAVPTPNARTQAILNQGTKANNILGQGVRALTQMKGYPTQMFFTIQSLLQSNPELVRKYGARGLTNFHKRSNMSLLGQMIAGQWIMGYVVLALKDLARNQVPRDPMDDETLKEAFVQGGAGTIYLDLLMAGTYSFGGGPAEALSGPTVGFASDALKLANRIASVDSLEDAGKRGEELTKFIVNNSVPNVPVFREALNYIALYHLYEAMDPGSLERLEGYREGRSRLWGEDSHLVGSPTRANEAAKDVFR